MKNEKLKVYIAGPMSGCPDSNDPAFFAAAERARELGYEPLNPAENAPEGWTHDQYMRRGIKMLMDADMMWMLPNWSMSIGTLLELHTAKNVHMPVYELVDGELYKRTPTGLIPAKTREDETA